ncbi:M23 family metallopeptidase [uncultured Campylobacter sp.]|uniref:M23 family metallopeptidase n=1 Tax=uncultured Campylobacter sp. TaxID=218934 RepID=UPI0025F3D5D9|nr:M23 family metallopeptidase [uncultured Campylobacter sp.]
MRGSKVKTFIFALIFIGLIFGVVGVLNSNSMDSEPPKISINSEIYWNQKTPIDLNISDNGTLQSFKVTLVDGQSAHVIMDEKFNEPQNQVQINLKFPKSLILDKNRAYELLIEAKDSSFLGGNVASKKVNLIIDSKNPQIQLINQSYKITKGGSAVVVFKAVDENLQSVYIQNGDRIFKPTKFVKDGYWASLLAWDLQSPNFKARIVAVDKAGNKSFSSIGYYLQDRKYKESRIALSDRFLDGKIDELANQYAQNYPELDRLAKFKFVNETLRDSNEDMIHKITSAVPEEIIDSFYIEPFYPLRNGAAVASFGDHRFYTYNGEDVSQSWHMGLDLASTAMASIDTQNAAFVAYNDLNGIYGENIILYHGFGLYTLYGHCNGTLVKPGEHIGAKHIIGKTGTSGLALGDHLHFGVLIQGVEVRPEEWMDRKWMKDNIYDILNSAKKAIKG